MLDCQSRSRSSRPAGWRTPRPASRKWRWSPARLYATLSWLRAPGRRALEGRLPATAASSRPSILRCAGTAPGDIPTGVAQPASP